MKPTAFILLLLAAIALRAEETHLPPVTGTNTTTIITSQSVDFDLKSRSAIYRGNVRVEDLRISLTCELLTARMPTNGGRVDSIIAETNVVIVVQDSKGETNHATAARVIYTYQRTTTVTNEMLELTGSPAIESPQGTLTGDTITWDRVKDVIRATNQRMTGHIPTPFPTNSSTNSVIESKPATP